MEQELVESIKQVVATLKMLVKEINADSDAEVDALGIVMDAYKRLRRIDLSELGQQPLPFGQPAFEPCPDCGGTGTVKDGADQYALCPRCQGDSKVKASSLQAELPVTEDPEQAEAFEELESAGSDRSNDELEAGLNEEGLTLRDDSDPSNDAKALKSKRRARASKV